jgi:hypothetical protein
MRGAGALAAAVMAAAALVCGASAVLSETAGPTGPLTLFFAGTDLWRYGQFMHGGVVLSPGGLDADGFVLKLMVGGGRYSFFSGGLNQDVEGRAFSATAMPGWRFRRGDFIATVYAGADLQDHRLSPDDPGARLRGRYFGARIAGEAWYQPDARTMVAASAMLSSIGPTGSARLALGWKGSAPVFIGPEAQMFWCADFSQLRIGAHVTGLRLDAFEWTAAGGWAIDSDERTGAYVRLGVIARY